MWKVISQEPLNRNKIPRNSKFSFCCLLLRRGSNNLQRCNGKQEKGDSGVRASQQGTEHVRWLEKGELSQGMLKEESGSFETNWIHFHLNQSLFYSDIPLFSCKSTVFLLLQRKKGSGHRPWQPLPGQQAGGRAAGSGAAVPAPCSARAGGEQGPREERGAPLGPALRSPAPGHGSRCCEHMP